ncbi:hypothetical protein ACLOJK_012780 [Asimina triloba]
MSGAGTPDFFYREAQRLGYVARSAFKLLQMQKQFKLVKQGASVLDLGCAPGAWLQVLSSPSPPRHLCKIIDIWMYQTHVVDTEQTMMVACQSLGPLSNGGEVVGVDLKVPSLHCDSRVRTVCADVMNLVKDQAQALSHQFLNCPVLSSSLILCHLLKFTPADILIDCGTSSVVIMAEARLFPSNTPLNFLLAEARLFPSNTPQAWIMSLLYIYAFTFNQESAYTFQGKGFSVVLSDMCPAVSGITTKDAALSIELGTQALSLALGRSVLPALDDHGEGLIASASTSAKNDGVLQQGGNLVIKLLESEATQGLGKISKTHFRKVSWLRPKATRSSSREIYLICQGLRLSLAFMLLLIEYEPEPNVHPHLVCYGIFKSKRDLLPSKSSFGSSSPRKHGSNRATGSTVTQPYAEREEAGPFPPWGEEELKIE